MGPPPWCLVSHWPGSDVETGPSEQGLLAEAQGGSDPHLSHPGLVSIDVCFAFQSFDAVVPIPGKGGSETQRRKRKGEQGLPTASQEGRENPPPPAAPRGRPSGDPRQPAGDPRQLTFRTIVPEHWTGALPQLLDPRGVQGSGLFSVTHLGPTGCLSNSCRWPPWPPEARSLMQIPGRFVLWRGSPDNGGNARMPATALVSQSVPKDAPHAPARAGNGVGGKVNRGHRGPSAGRAAPEVAGNCCPRSRSRCPPWDPSVVDSVRETENASWPHRLPSLGRRGARQTHRFPRAVGRARALQMTARLFTTETLLD